LQPHKGDATGKFKALSSACEIVNERLMKCVKPAQKNKNKAELMPPSNFFQITIRDSSCSLTMSEKSKKLAKCLLKN
jgi:hypothetical protein